MAHSLDIMPVGIHHKRTIIMLVIMRPWARRAIVHTASSQRSGMERIYLSAAIRSQADMQLAARRIIFCNPEPGRVSP